MQFNFIQQNLFEYKQKKDESYEIKRNDAGSNNR